MAPETVRMDSAGCAGTQAVCRADCRSGGPAAPSCRTSPLGGQLGAGEESGPSSPGGVRLSDGDGAGAPGLICCRALWVAL